VEYGSEMMLGRYDLEVIHTPDTAPGHVIVLLVSATERSLIVGICIIGRGFSLGDGLPDSIMGQ